MRVPQWPLARTKETPKLTLDAVSDLATMPADATKTAKTLQKHVRGLESSLALPLLKQIAQQRQTCVYRAPRPT